MASPAHWIRAFIECSAEKKGRQINTGAIETSPRPALLAASQIQGATLNAALNLTPPKWHTLRKSSDGRSRFLIVGNTASVKLMPLYVKAREHRNAVRQLDGEGESLGKRRAAHNKQITPVVQKAFLKFPGLGHGYHPHTQTKELRQAARTLPPPSLHRQEHHHLCG
ncbi:hypothetical protein D3C80_1416570 [compost metagenome]